LGQLVEAGEGVVAPRVRQQPVAAYPIQAKRLRKEAKVEVRVLVDENGKVLDTELIGSPEYGFGAEAERAIRAASFFPAQKNGVKVKMWTVVSIQFSLE
jgi:TonB family protein